ncbi:MAG: hypothetical protein HGJ97_19300 [Desulfosporosinus sp.]|nr:hypothetical protein [Desulfosporosinus sp.]
MLHQFWMGEISSEANSQRVYLGGEIFALDCSAARIHLFSRSCKDAKRMLSTLRPEFAQQAHARGDSSIDIKGREVRV